MSVNIKFSRISLNSCLALIVQEFQNQAIALFYFIDNIIFKAFKIFKERILNKLNFLTLK
jgi:hypothetical protein